MTGVDRQDQMMAYYQCDQQFTFIKIKDSITSSNINHTRTFTYKSGEK